MHFVVVLEQIKDIRRGHIIKNVALYRVKQGNKQIFTFLYHWFLFKVVFQWSNN
jgi:hypothetical protein